MLNALNNIYRFIGQFICYWIKYPEDLYFAEHQAPKDLVAKDKENGVFDEWYGSRLRYAWKCARVWWNRRDRYSWICTGDCEHCSAKHC